MHWTGVDADNKPEEHWYVYRYDGQKYPAGIEAAAEIEGVRDLERAIDAPEAAGILDRILGMFPEFPPRDEQHPRSGVFENKSYLLDGLCRIDRYVHRPQ